MNSRIHGMIRSATDHDMELIGRWLLETSRSGVDSLWPNWRLTQKVHAKEKSVRVFVEGTTGEPVAYFWGSLNTSDSILDVRPSHRGRGVGRLVVDHLIEESRSLREPLLHITCSPESSEHFWNKMGFTTEHAGGSIWASRVIEIPNKLPEAGKQRDITVRFFDDAGAYGDAPALSEYAVRGLEDEFGTIHLPRILACYEPRGSSALHVEIAMRRPDELLILHKSKCRNQAAVTLGVEDCLNGYCVAQIRLGSNFIS